MKIKTYLDKLPSLEGKVIVITGANSGLGLEACKHLAYKNANVIMACRNLAKGQKALDSIKNEYPNASLTLIEYDQADFASIDRFIEIMKNIPHIDAFVNNAGVYYPKADYKTKDEYELTFGTNYLGVFHLVEGLLDKFNNDETRVIGLASIAAVPSRKKLPINKTNILKRNGIYGYSKLCIERYFYELMNGNYKASFRLVHPGVSATGIISSSQTGLPNWVSIAGHRFLTLFTHSAKKASLVILKGIVSTNETKPYIGPRGPFAISGFPKEKKVPKFAHKFIRQETYDFLRKDV